MEFRRSRYTKEEIDEKLSELRADPEKAAKFKSDLKEKAKNLWSARDKLDSPIDEIISKTFSFLVSDYGYVEHEKEMWGMHNATTVKKYSSDNLTIAVWAGGFDNGSFCGINFIKPNKLWINNMNKYDSLHELLKEKDPKFEHPRYGESADIIKSHLEMYAYALLEYGHHLLVMGNDHGQR